MWSRESIKNYAKDFLRKHYWKAFLVCLIASILTGGGNGSSSGNSDINNNHITNSQYEYEMHNGMPGRTMDRTYERVVNNIGGSFLFRLSRGVLPIMFLIFIVLLITVGYAIEVGKVRFFLRGFKGDVSIGNLFSTFNSEEYFGIVQTQFIKSLYQILWTLLFIIPGIIKHYEYMMVPYIISEEPYLSSSEAIERSRIITEGHKMDMFILDLSFIGWYLLGALFFGIGGIFVNPYKEATIARLYNILSGDDNMDNDFIEDDLIFE